MGDPLQASNAWAMGNLGLSTVLRDDAGVSSYDDEDLDEAPTRSSRLVGIRGRAIRWSIAAGMFVAYANHWPGGH